MIVETIDHVTTYKSLGKNIHSAINFLESVDMDALEDGRIDVDGEEVYAVVSSYETRDNHISKYEVHREYIDIQTLIEGEEIIFLNDRSIMKPDGQYNHETDKLNLIDSDGEMSLLLKRGRFTIFFPDDAHKACCLVDGRKKNVRKLLLKVK